MSEFVSNVATWQLRNTHINAGKSDDPLTTEALVLRAGPEQARDDEARQAVADYISMRADEIAGDPVETTDRNSGATCRNRFRGVLPR